ncbi:hypothetical protein BMS81_04025, partial [Leuconostoc pseudomesenteroides]
MESIQLTSSQWQENAQQYQPALMADLLQFLAIPSVLDPTTANIQRPFGTSLTKRMKGAVQIILPLVFSSLDRIDTIS